MTFRSIFSRPRMGWGVGEVICNPVRVGRLLGAALSACLIATVLATAAGASTDGGPDGVEDFSQIARGGLEAGAPSSGVVPAPSTPIGDVTPPLAGYSGTSDNSYAWSSAWFSGYLFVGTVRNAFDPENAPLAERRAEIWRYAPDGPRGDAGLWQRVYQSPVLAGQVAKDVGYRGMIVCDAGDGVDRLYVTTIGAGGRVLYTANGSTFNEASTTGLETPNILSGDLGDIGYRSLACVDGTNSDDGTHPWLYITPVGSLTDPADFATVDTEGSDNPVVLGNSNPVSGTWEQVSEPGFGSPENGTNFVIGGYDTDGNGIDDALVSTTLNRATGVEVWVNRSTCTGTSSVSPQGGLFGFLRFLLSLGSGTSSGPGPCTMEAGWELAIDAGGQRPPEPVDGVPTLRSTVAGAMDQFGDDIYVTVAETRSATRNASSEVFRFRYTGSGPTGYSWDVVVGAPRPLSATSVDPGYECADTTNGQCNPVSGYGAGFAEDGPGTLGDPNEGEAEYVWRVLGSDDGHLYVTTNVSGLLNPDPFESQGSIEDRLLGITAEFEAGFNMYRTSDGDTWEEMFDNGLGNPLNSGGRSLVDIPGFGIAVGTANANTDHPLGGFEVYLGGCVEGADPRANAGLDRTYYDEDPTDSTYEVTINLNGVWSGPVDCGATITSHQWNEGTCASPGDPVTGGDTARVEGLVVDVGTDDTARPLEYALTVTDSDARTGCDDVVITASTDQAPTPTIASVPVAHCQFGIPDAFCGDGLVFEARVGDTDGDGLATVELTGVCTDREDGLTADCEWVVPDSVSLSGSTTEMTNTATVPVGGFRGVVLYLKATDSAGQVTSAALAVSVVSPNAPDLSIFDDVLIPVSSGGVVFEPFFCEGLAPPSRCDVIQTGFAPASPKVGETTQLAVLVRNQRNNGAAVVPRFRLSNAAGDTFRAATTAPYPAPPFSRALGPKPALAPGEQTYYLFDWIPTAAGPQDITVNVRPESGETDTADNTTTISFDVLPADLLANDAAVVSVAPDSASMEIGETQTVDVTVRNAGTGGPLDVDVSLTDENGAVGSTQTVSALGSGDSEVVTFSWTPTTAVTHTLTATAVLVGETDENASNNTASTQVAVTPEQPDTVEAHIHSIATSSPGNFFSRSHTVVYTVFDSTEVPVENATVTVNLGGAGLFNGPETKTCVTNGSGQCTITDTVSLNWAQTYVVTDVELTGASVYVPADNDWDAGSGSPAIVTVS